jgi:hypothetical protein
LERKRPPGTAEERVFRDNGDGMFLIDRASDDVSSRRPAETVDVTVLSVLRLAGFRADP